MQIPKEQGYDTIVEGQLLKKILKEGEGPFPKKGQKVSALYKGSLTNGEVFDSNTDRESPFEFTLGQGQVIKGWDNGFASMRKGEKAILVCSPDFAYGKRGSPPKIPPNSTLHFEVELLDFQDKKKEKYQYTDEQKLTQSTKFKDQGNVFFKTGNFSDAVRKYKDSLQLIQDLENEEAHKLLITVRLNSAMANIKIKDYARAVELTTKVLQKQSNNSKGLFRRATANIQLGNFDKARVDLNLLITNEPGNSEAKKQLDRLKAIETKTKQHEKKLFNKMFSANLYEDKKIEAPKKQQEAPKRIESSSDQQQKIQEKN